MSKDQKPEPQAASFDVLASKKPAEEKVTVEVDGAEYVMVFRSIGRDAFEALVNEHTDEGAEAENYETFAPALIAASSYDPKLTPEQVAVLYEKWNRSEVNTLYRTAAAANLRSSVVKMGEG